MQKSIFRIWALNQSLGMILGWFFHGLISHVFTGEHGDSLTTPQLLMHIVSLTGTALIILYFQNRATQKLFDLSLMLYWLTYLTIPTVLFWVGYYLLGVPMDILFHFIGLGILNGVYIGRATGLKHWRMFSGISGIVGFLIGALILYPLDPYLNSFSGLMAHVIMFTSLGIIAGIPMAAFNGFVLAKLNKRKLSRL